MESRILQRYMALGSVTTSNAQQFLRDVGLPPPDETLLSAWEDAAGIIQPSTLLEWARKQSAKEETPETFENQTEFQSFLEQLDMQIRRGSHSSSSLSMSEVDTGSFASSSLSSGHYRFDRLFSALAPIFERRTDTELATNALWGAMESKSRGGAVGGGGISQSQLRDFFFANSPIQASAVLLVMRILGAQPACDTLPASDSLMGAGGDGVVGLAEGNDGLELPMTAFAASCLRLSVPPETAGPAMHRLDPHQTGSVDVSTFSAALAKDLSLLRVVVQAGKRPTKRHGLAVADLIRLVSPFAASRIMSAEAMAYLAQSSRSSIAISPHLRLARPAASTRAVGQRPASVSPSLVALEDSNTEGGLTPQPGILQLDTPPPLLLLSKYQHRRPDGGLGKGRATAPPRPPMHYTRPTACSPRPSRRPPPLPSADARSGRPPKFAALLPAPSPPVGALAARTATTDADLLSSYVSSSTSDEEGEGKVKRVKATKQRDACASAALSPRLQPTPPPSLALSLRNTQPVVHRPLTADFTASAGSSAVVSSSARRRPASSRRSTLQGTPADTTHTALVAGTHPDGPPTQLCSGTATRAATGSEPVGCLAALAEERVVYQKAVPRVHNPAGTRYVYAMLAGDGRRKQRPIASMIRQPALRDTLPQPPPEHHQYAALVQEMLSESGFC